MIWILFIDAFVWALNLLFSWLPKVTSLPYGIDTAISQASSVYNSFIVDFWLLSLPWTLTLWYLGILFTLMILRLVRIIR
jgi:hypothetical protein